MPARPLRVKLKNELGIRTSLPSGEQYLELLGSGDTILILFPGPEPKLCLPLLQHANRVFLLRIPEVDNQLPTTWHEAIPDSWQPVNAQEAAHLLPDAAMLHYTPALRLFPSYIAPLLARLKTAGSPGRSREIWLPGPPDALIIPELQRAATQLGFTPRLLPATLPAADLARALTRQVPHLFLSLNFHGLDPYGENQALLQAAGAPVAAWCVDNPFHILTGQKNRLWMQTPLFVTDDWFTTPLRALGADARHLPLATDPAVFTPGHSCPTGTDLTFVGRSRFPDKDRFFAASSLPQNILDTALAQTGRTAHFGWWAEQTGVPLWPGNDVRMAGLGAERLAEHWRATCLNAAARDTDLTIVGDAAWNSLVRGHTLRPPVDYFHGLADVYRQASYSLNLTSLLLPHGLTQRHFDVWACGGFLITDTTPGLHIFPAELTEPITFDIPEHIGPLVRSLTADPAHRESLRQAWQHHILEKHTYRHRLQHILELAAP